MEKEFSNTKVSNASLSLDIKNAMQKAVAVCVSLVLALLMTTMGAQASQVQIANADTPLPRDRFGAPGWSEEDGHWYHYGSSGAMTTGWIKTGGAWYYLDPETGAMQVGKRAIDGATYIFADSGAMMTGWSKEGAVWCYYGPSGAMATGWIATGGAWYYLDPETGAMQVGKRTIDGATTSS